MSGIEELLVRDIAAVTKGVVVTERELLEARSAIDEHAEAEHRRGRRRTIALVAAAALVVAGMGFGAVQALSQDAAEVSPAGQGDPTEDVYADFLTGDAPTPENLNGFWLVENGRTMVRFQSDGVVQISGQGTVISDPDIVGAYTIKGDTISVKAAYAPDCPGGRFSMRAALPKPGVAHLVLSGPRFGTCGTPATVALEHVLPTDSWLADLTTREGARWRPVSNMAVLHGDWMAEGGGHLLEIAADETFYVADESGDVVDNGAWRVRGSALELFSRTESPRCDEGNMLVLGNLEYTKDGRGPVGLRGTVDQNDCGGGWTPAAWLRIPDAISG